MLRELPLLQALLPHVAGLPAGCTQTRNTGHPLPSRSLCALPHVAKHQGGQQHRKRMLPGLRACGTPARPCCPVLPALCYFSCAVRGRNDRMPEWPGKGSVYSRRAHRKEQPGPKTSIETVVLTNSAGRIRSREHGGGTGLHCHSSRLSWRYCCKMSMSRRTGRGRRYRRRSREEQTTETEDSAMHAPATHGGSCGGVRGWARGTTDETRTEQISPARAGRARACACKTWRSSQLPCTCPAARPGTCHMRTCMWVSG